MPQRKRAIAYASDEVSDSFVFGGGLVFFVIGAGFSFSGIGSTAAAGFGGGTGAGGLGSRSFRIANMVSPIPTANAAQIASAIVAYKIVLSVLQTALSV